jgi:hypothetical protein
MVLGWLLRNPRVSAMGRVMHEMCSYSHHLHESMGMPLHTHSMHHPMLQNHRAPTESDRDQVHTFWLSDGRQGFRVMVFDGQNRESGWIAISPDGDFNGASVQATRKGQYMVNLDRYSARPHGRLAANLVKEFITKYDAVDTTG